MAYTKEDIKSIECRHVIHIPANDHRDDAHYIREVITYTDGVTRPNIRLLKNFERPFWVTQPSSRNHKDNKERESLENLLEYKCTQSELAKQISIALGTSHARTYLRKLSKSPYLYGTDITSTAIIKHMYMEKYPNALTPNKICVLDIETETINDITYITMCSIVMADKTYTAVTEKYFAGHADAVNKVHAGVRKHLGDKVDIDSMDMVVEIVKDDMEIVRNCFRLANDWSPDFLAIWNMNYDLPIIVDTCIRHNESPADILSDPNIPKEYKHFHYKEGPSQKVTASGKFTPINPAMRWHTAFLTSTFYVIDAMCVYKQLRIHMPEVPGGYSLDNILKVELGSRKLKFEEADDYSGLAWHKYMADKYPVEYVVYNLWDCLSIIELDKKTNDLAYTLTSFAAHSDFQHFKSQPKLIMDVLHYYLLDRGYVIGTVPPFEEDGPIDETLGLANWIVTLAPHMLTDGGMRCIESSDDLITNVYPHTYDSDAVSSYPSNTCCLNVSKEVTMREVISVDGIGKETLRHQNLNMMSGETNSIEYCSVMFGFPTLSKLSEIYDSKEGSKV